MIIIDPYIIDSVIAKRISQFLVDGMLLPIEPDEEHGFTCEAVFGVRPDQIAAVHFDDSISAAGLFQLIGGRLIACEPGTGKPVSVPDTRTEH